MYDSKGTSYLKTKQNFTLFRFCPIDTRDLSNMMPIDLQCPFIFYTEFRKWTCLSLTYNGIWEWITDMCICFYLLHVNSACIICSKTFWARMYNWSTLGFSESDSDWNLAHMYTALTSVVHAHWNQYQNKIQFSLFYCRSLSLLYKQPHDKWQRKQRSDSYSTANRTLVLSDQSPSPWRCLSLNLSNAQLYLLIFPRMY